MILLITAPTAAATLEIPVDDGHERYFDRDLEALVRGVISDVSYSNPSLSFRLVSVLDGTVWKMKIPAQHADSAGMCGWSRLVKRLDKGTIVSVAGWPSKDGANKLAVIRMVIAGDVIMLRRRSGNNAS
jgi:hypothetical protein